MSNITETTVPVTVVRVADEISFSGENWREAIIRFLNKLWTGEEFIMNPWLSFNDTVIRKCVGKDEYYAYFQWQQDGPSTWDSKPRVSGKHSVSYPSSSDVEAGLIRFVRNNKIRQLVLSFPGVGNITLTKGQKRSDLSIATEFHLPSMQAEMRRNGHKV